MNRIKDSIIKFYEDKTQKNVIHILESIRACINDNKTIISPKPARQVKLKNGDLCYTAFTDNEELNKGEKVDTMEVGIEKFLETIYEAENNSGVIINPWDKSFYLSKEMISSIFEANEAENRKSRLYLDQGDITRLQCDCIVNAANSSLLGGSGVDGAIHKAAGPELLEECKKLNGCETGEAKITKGYNLKAKYVIHTVGPVFSGQAQDKIQLSKCYTNSLNLAKENNIHSIAFPAISTGAYGYPLEAAIVIAVTAVINWIGNNREYPMDIIFSCFDKKTYDAYVQYINNSFNNNIKG